MAVIRIDTDKKTGRIKPMHAVGQPPLAGAKCHYFHYLTEAGIPYSRLHDVGGPYAADRFVDIPNIFRNFDADASDPANYDFTFTDHLIKNLFDAGVEPYFRLGVTIENDVEIKGYRIDPPADYEKWARICEHIVAHYTEGWADGYFYNIKYWEIWNEPDNKLPDKPSEMWSGTAEDYYRLYDVTAKHLKKRFPNILVGGYGSCGFYEINDTQGRPENVLAQYRYFMDFFHGFFSYVKEHSSPIDFFSWHSYSNTKKTVERAEWLEKALDEYGYGNIEVHLNEWNPFARERGTAHHSAEVAAMMLGMQNTSTDVMCIYDARLMGTYGALFDPLSFKPFHAYYSMVAFNMLYMLGTQISLECNTEGLYAVAATDGEKTAIMIANLSGRTHSLSFDGVELSKARWSVIDQQRLLSWSPELKNIENNTVVLIEI